jgi:beta-barrel assembly-enhancing protease
VGKHRHTPMIVLMHQRISPSLRRTLACLLAAAAVFAWAWPVHGQLRSNGIDNLPALGEASVDELSPVAEQRLGDQIFREFLRAGVVHDDPETTDAMTRQASRLLASASGLGHTSTDRPFRFFVVKDPSINAFALPGGYIGIHTGLITTSEYESEVMGVLAHEIGHVTQRHIARMFGQQRKSSAVMIAAAVLAAMAASASPDAAMGVLSLGQTFAIRDQLAFSRDAEREADRVGLQILAESGFNPSGMASMFERLGQAGRLYENNAPGYLRTHPLTTERVADMQSRLQTDRSLQAASLAAAMKANSTDFDWPRQKLIALADTRVDGLRAARQRFEIQLADEKNKQPQQQAALYFGLAWAAFAQRDFSASSHYREQALQFAQRSGIEPAVAPYLVNLQLQQATAQGNSAMAQSLASSAVAQFGTHRAVMRSAIELALLSGGSVDQAVQWARLATQQWPNDSQTWALLARAEGARGAKASQHAALAEQFALAGAYSAAVEQLTLARSAGDADFITLSKIDARLTTMRALLRAEQLERQQGR